MAHKELIEQDGWVKRFAACEPRLSEAVKMYQDSVFDVRLGPFSAGSKIEPGCMTCFKGYEDHFAVIYTRTKNTTQGM